MINLIAPVLRMQLGINERHPVVRFVEATDRDAVALSISESMDETAVIEAAAKVLGSESGVEAVNVEGIGAFEIDPVDEKSQGRVAGRVMIVTGAAQGFGLGIAQDLAKEGACVVLADINIGEAENQAEALRKEYGPSRAKAVSMNVTDQASIQSAI
ncbi:MAG: SDR family NAD(P)-dependent oxidoreductase, partial [Verrucomicrobiota bacterium]|nr:SDR family NAD(P)-dependent oxidoreductase [Verrucomicrobiota bacterium]